jgi:uncharacterized protein (TIGR01244 family)
MALGLRPDRSVGSSIMNRPRAALLALPFAVLTTVLSAAPTLLLPLPNARVPIAGVLSGGQPTQEQVAAAGAAGCKTVINLRPETEPGFAWEPEAVRAAGMAYVSIPVAGAAGLTRENVARFDAALEEATARGPVILHCSSGNRAGALLALRAAWLEGKDPATALEYGRASGLTGLEPAVTSLLGPQAAPAQAPK